LFSSSLSFRFAYSDVCGGRRVEAVAACRYAADNYDCHRRCAKRREFEDPEERFVCELHRAYPGRSVWSRVILVQRTIAKLGAWLDNLFRRVQAVRLRRATLHLRARSSVFRKHLGASSEHLTSWRRLG